MAALIYLTIRQIRRIWISMYLISLRNSNGHSIHLWCKSRQPRLSCVPSGPKDDAYEDFDDEYDHDDDHDDDETMRVVSKIIVDRIDDDNAYDNVDEDPYASPPRRSSRKWSCYWAVIKIDNVALPIFQIFLSFLVLLFCNRIDMCCVVFN